MADPIVYSGFEGMNNRASDQDVPDGQLRDACNVDNLSSGKLRRRRGLEQLISSPGAHSVFSDEKSAWLVWATSNALHVADKNFDHRTILTSPLLGDPLSYAVVNGEIYFSNEGINGKITAAGEYSPWGIVPPALPPTLAATPGVFTVMVTCTFVTATGEESGAPIAAEVSCGPNAVITVTNIPQSPDPRVVATRLYASLFGGTVMYHAMSVQAGGTSAVLAGWTDKGAPLKTQFMVNPPPGQTITETGGRIYIATGAAVVATEPLGFGLVAIDQTFLLYTSRVTLLRGVPDGLYVGAETINFLPNPGTEAIATGEVLPYAAIEGATCDVPDSDDFYTLTERGMCRAGRGGNIRNLTEDQLAMTDYDRAALGFIAAGGHKAVVAIVQGGSESPLVSEDFKAALLLP